MIIPSSVWAVRPTDAIDRAAFKAAGIRVIEPEEQEEAVNMGFQPRDFHVDYVSDVASVFAQHGDAACGFRFWFVRNGRPWAMDFAGTGMHTAPEVVSPGAV